MKNIDIADICKNMELPETVNLEVHKIHPDLPIPAYVGDEAARYNELVVLILKKIMMNTNISLNNKERKMAMSEKITINKRLLLCKFIIAAKNENVDYNYYTKYFRNTYEIYCMIKDGNNIDAIYNKCVYYADIILEKYFNSNAESDYNDYIALTGDNSYIFLTVPREHIELLTKYITNYIPRGEYLADSLCIKQADDTIVSGRYDYYKNGSLVVVECKDRMNFGEAYARLVMYLMLKPSFHPAINKLCIWSVNYGLYAVYKLN